LRAVASREDERAVARCDHFGDRRNHLAVDVDVEDRDVELGRPSQLDRFVDVAGFGGHAVAEFLEHIGDHHADHDLVFDQEDGAARRVRCSHGRFPCPNPLNKIANSRVERNLDALPFS
jgi:hypothetical protein